jgi:hypothetical protein
MTKALLNPMQRLTMEIIESLAFGATWVMHTKSTPRDDSARLVAGRQ